ncbi:MAG: preprotein translocase subunit SecY [Clostridia bacterium]|nr:preprotein translocase subunit SecY [Clostridia bacterium]
MFAALSNAWKVPELRKKLLFTLMMFVIFRLGCHIPVPGIDKDLLASMFQSDIFGWIDIISGGSFKNLTIFAMGIIPYINASIIIQLMTMVVPYFERLQKSGYEGRKKMAQYVRYGAVGLGLAQAVVMSIYLKGAMIHPGFFSILTCVVVLTAGTAFLMWLGEQITENGIGNGISLIIFAGIVSRLPAGIMQIYEYVRSGTVGIIAIVIFVIVAVLMVTGVIAVQEGQRRISVQYSKRVIGRKIYGGQSTHIPMKINQAGVIPIIFAMAILTFPSVLAGLFSPTSAIVVFLNKVLSYQHPVYIITYSLLIFFFTYIYTAATFNTADVADNMRKNGGFIPGLRPGKPTAEYLDRVLSRLTFSGATFLTLIALMPSIFMSVSGMNLYFGGTSLLIAVGVALDTMKQIESHLLMRHYQGFMK